VQQVDHLVKIIGRLFLVENIGPAADGQFLLHGVAPLLKKPSTLVCPLRAGSIGYFL
jgi:hypothetical protein